MSTETTQPAMIFYEQPTLLSRETHRDAKLLKAPDLSFAAGSNSFLLAARELVDAMHDYPVVFVGQPGAAFTLAVVTGLRENRNLFVDDKGQWQEGRYLPAFVRRYPFVLVEDDNGGDEMQIAIDASCAWLDLEGKSADGERLLDESGANTTRLEEINSFLVRFHHGMKESHEFATHLSRLGILVKRVIEVKQGNRVDALENFWVVDERALQSLTAENHKDLVMRGYMGWIYFHLASLTNVTKLAVLADNGKSMPPAPGPVT